MNGFLYINKPVGPTSHDIVDRVRSMSGIKTVGHAGTLDPFASGLLIVGVGREATREFPKLVGLDKRYRATLRLGATSDTDDKTGVIKNQKQRTKFQKTDIETVLKQFTGKIQQIPPMYSAKKIKGKKLYELARAGQTVERAPVEIEIYSISINTKHEELNSKNVVLDIHCSSGTYIRALARDIGEALGCGAYLEELERIAVGPFTLSEAVKMTDLNKENIISNLHDISKTLERIRS